MENAANSRDDDAAGARPSMDRRSVPLAEELRTAVRDGRPVRRGRGEPAAEGRSWGENRKLPAELLYELLGPSGAGEDLRAAVLVGVRITGRLNFEAAKLHAPLIAHGCYFDQPINLIAATAPEIRLTACQLPGIVGDNLETRNDVDLSGSALGLVSLVGARIGGQLSFNGATLTSGRWPIDLVEGTLRMLASSRETLDGVALMADGVRVDQGMLCGQGFGADGEVRLPGARIAGNLVLDRARLSKGLVADGLQVGQAMLCRAGFTAGGEVRMRGAHISGALEFDAATLAGGLYASALRADQGMFCRAGFRAEGEVRMRGAHVSGQLDFDGARLAKGLVADGLQVDLDMLCGQGFRADGEVRLSRAHIAGWLSFDGATLSHPDRALHLGSASVDRELRLLFTAPPSGGVDLTSARLGRLLDSERTWPPRLELRGCVYAVVEASEDARKRFEAADTEHETRLLARLRWRHRGAAPPDVQRRLRWIELAEEGHLYHTRHLRRVVRNTIGPTTAGSPTEAASSHRTWRGRDTSRGRRQAGPDATRQSGRAGLLRARRTPAVPRRAAYAPQPYTQLAAFYRQEGRDGDARRVAYARERRREAGLSFAGRIWSVFLRSTVGYGYKPLRALTLLSVLIVVGTLIFSHFHSEGRMRAIENDHPPFVASIYTLDRLLPVVSFGLRDAFAPTGAARWWAFAYTLLGWALTVAVVAGLNAAVRRE